MHFGTLDVNTCLDARVQAMDDLTYRVWTIMITGPQRNLLPGLQHPVSAQGFADLIGREGITDDVKASFKWLLKEHRIEYDPRSMVMHMPQQWKYNLAGGPATIKSWWGLWRRIPPCDLKTTGVETIRKALARLRPGKKQSSWDGWELAWEETFGTITGGPILSDSELPITLPEGGSGGPPEGGSLSNSGHAEPTEGGSGGPLCNPSESFDSKTLEGGSGGPPRNPFYESKSKRESKSKNQRERAAARSSSETTKPNPKSGPPQDPMRDSYASVSLADYEPRRFVFTECAKTGIPRQTVIDSLADFRTKFRTPNSNQHHYDQSLIAWSRSKHNLRQKDKTDGTGGDPRTTAGNSGSAREIPRRAGRYDKRMSNRAAEYRERGRVARLAKSP